MRWAPAGLWTLVVLGATLTPVRGPAPAIPGLDLLLHAVLFGVLAALVGLALEPGASRRRRRGALAALLLFAALDELAQTAVPGRTSSALDLAADAAGLAIATAAARFARRVGAR